MKKLAFLFVLTVTMLLTACSEQEVETTIRTQVMKQEVFHPFTFDNIPESLRGYEDVVTDIHDYVEKNQYRNPYLIKLQDGFAYTEELLDIFNLMINDVIKPDEINIGETVESELYTYSLEEENNQYVFRIFIGETRIIQGITDLNGYYEGEFHYEGDDLEFIVKDDNLSLSYYDSDEDSGAEYEIIFDAGVVKVTITYEDDVENYVLKSVGNANYSAIYVDDHKLAQKRLTINDEAGFILYEAVTKGEQIVSGYHLYALEGFNTLYKIGDETYLVDDIEFSHQDMGSNLYEVKLPYLATEPLQVTKDVILLGTLEGTFNELITLRNPFTSKHIEGITHMHSRLVNYGMNQS